MTLIIGASWVGLHTENLPLSITACVDWGITCYERERGKSCINISRDYGRSVCLELQVQREDLWDGKELGVVKALEV